MGLLSTFKFGAKKADKRPASGADAAQVVRAARVKARRRLIGAALLLGAGIIGFPLLFETQPRPIPVDIAIDIPAREGAAPLLPPAAPTAKATVTPPPVDATPDEAQPREIIEPVVKPDPAQAKPDAKPPAAAVAKVADQAVDKPVAKPVDKPAPKVADKVADKPPEKRPAPQAEPKSEPKAVAKVAEAAVADTGRFVVQVGAFAEAGSAREARMKVEALGLKAYTQVIESSGGRRIRVRVGPFTNKADAEKAAVRIKLSGLPAAVLTL